MGSLSQWRAVGGCVSGLCGWNANSASVSVVPSQATGVLIGGSPSTSYKRSNAGHEAASENHRTRAWCPKCDRAAKVCVCSSIPDGAPYETKTRLIVLVHPKEVKRKCGTLPLLRACLKNLQIIEGEKFPEPEEDPGLHEELAAGGCQAALVCPGPNAVSPDNFLAACRCKQGHRAFGSTFSKLSQKENEPPPIALILIDGTWNQAKSMVYHSKWLQQIPRVVISSSDASRYSFRQQPQEGCLSTLEAAAEALAALEGAHGAGVKTALLGVFAKMVKEQTSFIPDNEAVDKNAPGGRGAFRKARVHKLASMVDRETLPPIYVCRWSHSIDGGNHQRMHIERVLWRTLMPEADDLCREMSKGRKIGYRLFAYRREKLPPDAVFECDPSDLKRPPSKPGMPALPIEPNA